MSPHESHVLILQVVQLRSCIETLERRLEELFDG